MSLERMRSRLMLIERNRDMAASSVLLEVCGIDKRFGGVHALRNVSFSVAKGEVHAIVGENGAGKSTLMKILSGVYQPDQGEVFLEGRKVTFNNARASFAAGISTIYQELNSFPSLNVAANIFAGREPTRSGAFLSEREMRSRAAQVLRDMNISMDFNKKLSDLPVAQQQLVEIAKALVHESRLVIMDEPNSALVDRETQALFEIIRGMRARGVTVLYISHRLEEVFEICDWISVMRDGAYIGTWKTAETTIPFIVSQMVGRDLHEKYPEQRQISEDAEVVLQVEDLSHAGCLDAISFDVRIGEILGFAGLESSGIRDLFYTLFSLMPHDKGTIRYLGRKVDFDHPLDAIRHNWGLVPANRRDHGLFMRWEIQQNTALVILQRILNKLGLVSEHRLRETADFYIDRLKIATDSPTKKVVDLSGGNQQKVVIAKWLATHPKVLILDDPTRGIDIGAKAEIYTLITELAKSGIALLFTSSEIDEVLGLSHRIMVMRDGRILKEFKHGEASKEDVLMYVSGDLESAEVGM